jgi:hypothetical protein
LRGRIRVGVERKMKRNLEVKQMGYTNVMNIDGGWKA